MYNRNPAPLCFLITSQLQCLSCRTCYHHCPISPHFYPFKILFAHSVLLLLVAFFSLTASNYLTISAKSYVFCSPNFSTGMVDEFCLCQLFYHLQIHAWRIVSAGHNILHSTTLLLSSKIRHPKKILQTFKLHFHLGLSVFLCVSYIQCLCAPGWTGKFCQFVENACLIYPNNCSNGATCIDMSQLREQPLFQCLCPRDFTGKEYTNHVEAFSFISF